MSKEKILKDPEIIKYLRCRDPFLSKVFDEVKGDAFYQVFGKPIFVILIGALIGQRIKYTTSKKYRKELYELIGDKFTPKELLEKLELLNLPQNKKSLITEVTNYVIDNNLTFNENNENDVKKEINSLINCKGVGPWTIQTVLLTSLEDLNVFPETDKFIQQRINKLYNINPNSRTLLNISSRWSPYKSVVTWYLWRWF